MPFESLALETSSSTSAALPSKAIISRTTDFWLIGGISMVAWVFSQAAVHFYQLNSAFDRQVSNWPYLFSALTLICNHPHFMASYRIAYGNGLRRVTQHWFTLIAVPLTMIVFFCLSYFISARTAVDGEWFSRLSQGAPHPSFLDGWIQDPDPGAAILRFGVWAMWILVGWHYAKQVYGIMLRYASLDQYRLSSIQKQILKYTLLAVVPTSFIGMTLQGNGMVSNFQDLPMTPFEIPVLAITLTRGLSLAGVILFIGCLIQNRIRTKQLPSINLLVPFVAFYLWWFPGLWPQPFAMIMVPFFHSLQYLPFAYQRIDGELASKSKKQSAGLTFNIISLLIIGFVMFDLLPTYLDDQLQTHFTLGSAFFMISIVVFLNVHHFFIDASIWRRSSPRQIK